MAIFKVLELEDAVQVSDKTRYDASKCYVSKGNDPIVAMTIQPGIDGSPINIFAAKVEDRYLDWQYDDFTFDIDSTNNKLDFNEGASNLVATLTGGTYSLTSLLTEIETQLNAAGTFSYTVSLDTKFRVTVLADGEFILLPMTGDNINAQILKHIGFYKDTQQGLSVTGKPVEYSFKKITLSITTDTTPTSSPVTETKDFYQKIYSEYGDHLFSDDSNLRLHEKDISKWVVKGRNTHLDIHRRAQTLIIEFLNGQGFVDIYHEPFTKWAFIEREEVREWSTYLALRLIFEDFITGPDDIFAAKTKKYELLEVKARNKYIRLDLDSDGVQDNEEYLRIRSGNIYVR